MSGMGKWYEEPVVDEGIVISTRIRLARNLKKYPFSPKLSEQEAKTMALEVQSAIINDRNPLHSIFAYIDVLSLAESEKLRMMEEHSISPVLLNKKQACGVLLNDTETISILVNEEDHIRIQVVQAGDQLDAAWDTANKIDDLIEESLEYAFDEAFGYLTACPTNVGTGMRASYMVHLPALEKTDQIPGIVQGVGKFGMTVRGIYGEGSKAMGAIYQISNQVTLGASEEEILSSLKNVLQTVMQQEKRLREKLLAEKHLDLEDMAGRSYGILTNAKKLGAQEAMEHLSNLRMGYLWGLCGEAARPQTNLCTLMMGIQPGSLQSRSEASLSPEERDRNRAAYLREQFLKEQIQQ